MLLESWTKTEKLTLKSCTLVPPVAGGDPLSLFQADGHPKDLRSLFVRCTLASQATVRFPALNNVL